MDFKESGARNPYRALLHKLTNVGLARPRLKSPANVWRKTHREEVEAEYERRINAGESRPKRSQQAAFRDKVARDLYAALDKEEKGQWTEQAKEEHQAALEQWKRDVEGPPSRDSTDRQRCIEGLVKFAQPILDLMCEATGWSATLITGGPEPAAGGRLGVLSVHSGTIPGSVKMNFGSAEHKQYKTHIVPTYSTFLRKCYSAYECRARALPKKNKFVGLASLDLEADGANFDVVRTSDASEKISIPATCEDTGMSSTGYDSEDNMTASPPPVKSHSRSPLNFTVVTTRRSPCSSSTAPSLPTPSVLPGSCVDSILVTASLPSPNLSVRQSPPGPSLLVHSDHPPPPLSSTQVLRPLPLHIFTNQSLLSKSPGNGLSRHIEQDERHPGQSVERTPPTKGKELENVSTPELAAEKIKYSDMLSSARKRSASLHLEHEQSPGKRPRFSTPICINDRVASCRNSPAKLLVNKSPKTSHSRPRRNVPPLSPTANRSLGTRCRKSRVAESPPSTSSTAPANKLTSEWFKPVLGMFGKLQKSSLISRWTLFEKKGDCENGGKVTTNPPCPGEPQDLTSAFSAAVAEH